VRGAAREGGPYRERRTDRDQALEAAQRWIADHGRYPQQREWEHRALGRPTTRTIKRRWGWDQLMRAAAGAGARAPMLEARKAHRLELLLTLRRAREQLGRWPTGLSLAFRRNASTCQITSYEGDWASTLQEALLSPALPQRVVISSSAWRCVIRHSPCSSR
jgi:hypothetical protein